MPDGRFPVSLYAQAGRAELKVRCGHLDTADSEAFEEACMKLLATRQPELAVDMCAVRTIPSIIIGGVAKARVMATGQGSHLLLVSNQKIADLFRMILGDLLEVQVPG